MCAEASALQFSWQAGQSWQTRPAWVSKGFLKAVVVSDASAALVVLPTLSSLVSDGAGKVAAAATTSHRHRPPSDLDPPPPRCCAVCRHSPRRRGAPYLDRQREVERGSCCCWCPRKSVENSERNRVEDIIVCNCNDLRGRCCCCCRRRRRGCLLALHLFCCKMRCRHRGRSYHQRQAGGFDSGIISDRECLMNPSLLLLLTMT